MAWDFPDSRSAVSGPMMSRCVHVSPAVSGCARTYSGQRPGRTSGPLYRVPPRLRRLSGTVGGCIWPREDHCDCRPGPRMARRTHRAACPFLVGPGSRGGVAELLSPLGALRRSALRRLRGWSPWSAMQRSRPGAPERIRLPPRRITLPAVTCRGPAADLACTSRSGTDAGRYQARGQISASPAHCRRQ